MAPHPSVLALFGPTGVGKTAVAIALADRLRERGEDPVAVSADALQVYAGLECLTGAATAVQRSRLEHRLVGHLPIEATSSAGRYATAAHAEIDGLLAAGRRPIIVGGTGLYLRAALADLDLRPPPAPGVRERWLAILAVEGPEALHGRLVARDAEAANRIEPADGRRLVRAHELLDGGVKPPAGPQLWTRETRHPTLLVGLVLDRGELVRRIDARVDAMVAGGAEREVRRADAAGASATARKALGFSELLQGDVEAMKRRTRGYARRQLTWMRKLPDVHLIDVTQRPPADVAAEIDAMIRA